MEKSIHYQVKSFASVYLEYKDGKFVKRILPNEAQTAPINKTIIRDFDNDGNLVVLAAGNLYASEVETPRADAGIGLFLKGNSKGSLQPINAQVSGLHMRGDVKDFEIINIKNQEYILSAKNNDFLEFIKIN